MPISATTDLAIAASLLALACGGGDPRRPGRGQAVDSDVAFDTAAFPTPATCGATAPVVSALHVGDALDLSGAGDLQVPVVATVDDPDGDLHLLRYELAFDTVLDGEVSAPVAQLTGRVAVRDAVRCGVDQVALTVRVVVDGVAVRQGTPYELGLVISDAAGVPSAPVVVTFEAPAP